MNIFDFDIKELEKRQTEMKQQMKKEAKEKADKASQRPKFRNLANEMSYNYLTDVKNNIERRLKRHKEEAKLMNEKQTLLKKDLAAVHQVLWELKNHAKK